MSLGEILVRRGKATREQIAQALGQKDDRSDGTATAQTLIEKGVITARDLLDALGAEFGCEIADPVDDELLDPVLVAKLPVDWARTNLLLPIRWKGGFGVLTSDPSNLSAIDDLGLLLGRDLVPVLATKEAILKAIESCYFRKQDSTQDLLNDMEDKEQRPAVKEKSRDDLLRVADQAPVTQLVNMILLDAVKAGASDVHIEPFETRVRIRIRVDGLLYEQAEPPKHMETGTRFPSQGDGQARHRREALAAGRHGAGEGGGTRNRHPRVDHPRGRRRARGAPIAQPGIDDPAAHRPGHGARSHRNLPKRHQGAARRDPGDGTDRQRQNDHAVCGAPRTGHPALQRADHRGPDRIPAPKRRADAGQAEDRPDVRAGTAAYSPPGPGCHSRGRDARPRNGGNCRACGPHRTPGFHHASYERCNQRAASAHRYGNPAVLALVGHTGFAGPAPRAVSLPVVQNSVYGDGRRHFRVRARRPAAFRRPDMEGQGLSQLPRRVQGPDGPFRTDDHEPGTSGCHPRAA